MNTFQAREYDAGASLTASEPARNASGQLDKRQHKF
jgi:hypothetical protein